MLLLCCLVGVVAFLCFAMGVVNLSTMVDQDESYNPSKLAEDRDKLEREHKEKQEEIGKLKKQVEDLEKKIKEKEKELEQLAYLGKDQDSAQKGVEKLKKEIEAENEKLESLRKKIAEESVEINNFNPWKDFKGTELLKNPQFVECRKDHVMLFPQSEIVGISELSHSDPFTDISRDHDGVVFLIRPDGFDVFRQVKRKAEQANLKIGYEPIDADWKLDFSK